MQQRLLILVTILAMVLVACETNDQASDSLSAQNQQPALVGYETTDLDVAADGLLATASGAALASGNVPLTAAIQRADALLQCLQDTGSVSGLMYLEESPGLLPEIGASLIVNQTRVERNLFACLTELGFGAQEALELEVCAAHGTFTVETDEFIFAYVGVGVGLCTGFETHFNNLNATYEGTYSSNG